MGSTQSFWMVVSSWMLLEDKAERRLGCRVVSERLWMFFFSGIFGTVGRS